MNIYINGEKFLDMDDFGDVKINTISGNHNSTITINGKEITQDDNEVIKIGIEGDINHLNAPAGSIIINGNVKSVYTMSGNVTINEGDVGKITTTSGNVFVKGGDCTKNIQTTTGSIVIA
jgi:hypothetical protein